MIQQRTNRGFTIVELLIVIVVIGILATISVVSYNGVQDRAKDTAAEQSAKQFQKKAEMMNAIEGVYPTGSTAASIAASLGTISESRLGPSLIEKIAEPGALPTDDKPVSYLPCNNGSTTPNGGGILTYWQKEGYKIVHMGKCSD